MVTTEKSLKAVRREKKKTIRMKVSGKSVIRLSRLLQDRRRGKKNTGRG